MGEVWRGGSELQLWRGGGEREVFKLCLWGMRKGKSSQKSASVWGTHERKFQSWGRGVVTGDRFTD